MLKEQEKIISRFKQAFGNQKDKKIVIYGTGINAEAIVKNAGEYCIIGLMDAAKTGETIYGLPVLSCEEVLACEANYIIVVARPSVYSVIYARIADFVEAHQIPVYDVDGNDISVFCREQKKENLYFTISEADLLEKLKVFDIVSFDVFDTLLMRKVLYPVDVYAIMEKSLKGKYAFDFAAERAYAENELLAQNLNPTIQEIYQKLGQKYGISEDDQKDLLKIEIETEKKVLVPRQKMLDIFYLCKKLEKQIYLITDMYLPASVLTMLLEENGIIGYEKLIISCEYETSKEQGLFSVLKKELGEKKCLHIGDNMQADKLSAEKVGIDTFYIMSGREMLENSLQDILLVNTESLEKRIFLGLYTAKAFNDPFILYQSEGRLPVRQSDEIGYLFIAPLLLGFIFWMIEQIRENNLDQILFGARDGYLIQKLYRMCCKYMQCLECDNEYILISRGSISVCATEDKARAYYLQYLAPLIISEGKIAFFDFMSKGTCHFNLEKVLKRQLFGLYFQKSESLIEEMNKLTFASFCDAENAYMKDYAIFKYCDFLEMIVTDFVPSFFGFDKNGNEMFYLEKRSSEHLEWIGKVQDEILKYTADFMEIYPYSGTLEFFFYDRIFGMIDPRYSNIELEYGILRMYDEYNNKQVDVGELFGK